MFIYLRYKIKFTKNQHTSLQFGMVQTDRLLLRAPIILKQRVYEKTLGTDDSEALIIC